MPAKSFLSFAIKLIVVQVVTYLVVGSIAYQLLTKPFYTGPDPLFASFMRTETQPETWGHVVTWFLPANLVRGLLMALALYPFAEAWLGWGYWKRCLSLAGLYLVFGFWAATVAAPGTIEGLVFLRPEFTPAVHLKVQPEIVVQGLALGAWLAGWVAPRRKPEAEPAA